MTRTNKLEQLKMQEQFKSYVSQIVYKHEHSSIELTEHLGKCKEAQRDMVIAAYHAGMLIQEGSSYQASKDFRDVDNYLYKQLCYYFNTDILEDDILNLGMESATSCEIALGNLAKLFWLSCPLSAKSISTDGFYSLFIVGFEGSYDWSNWKYCLENNDFDLDRDFTTFENDELTQDFGWSPEEESELKSALPFDTFKCYSTQSHTMIKII